MCAGLHVILAVCRDVGSSEFDYAACDIGNRFGFCICQNYPIYVVYENTFIHITLKVATFGQIFSSVCRTSLFFQENIEVFTKTK